MGPADGGGLLPQLLTITQCERALGRQVFTDMRLAGWIRPRCVKRNTRKPREMYARVDVRACEGRMLAGEYPEPRAGRRRLVELRGEGGSGKAEGGSDDEVGSGKAEVGSSELPSSEFRVPTSNRRAAS